jgi:hypothetical protein
MRSDAKQASLVRWQKAGLGVAVVALLVVGACVWRSDTHSDGLHNADATPVGSAKNRPLPRQEAAGDEGSGVSDNQEEHQRKLKTELNQRWVQYLRDIQEDGDDQNWSGRPYDMLVKSQRK